MNTAVKNHIENCITKFSNKSESFNWQSVGGGSINQAYKVVAGPHLFFVKINSIAVFENGFLEEVKGLEFLRLLNANVPTVVDYDTKGDTIFLILSWVESCAPTNKFWSNFGHQLADLHRNSNANFGLDHMNFMGQLEQHNSFTNNFIDFFVSNRLKPQVAMAFDVGLLDIRLVKQFEKVYAELINIIPPEDPSAVHGDLWSGNFICATGNKAVFIDPAVYYGHREIDLAMTTLFGGFAPQFYQSYQEHYPLTPGFDNRKDYYNLYPLLIHLNLFGSSYLGGIRRIVSQF